MLIREAVEVRNAGLLGCRSANLRRMADEGDKTAKIDPKEAMSHIGGAIVTGGLGFLSAIVPGLKEEVVQTFVNTMAPVLGLAASNALNRAITRRSQVFAAGVLAGMGGDPEEASKRIHEKADDEDTQEMLLEAFRKMMNAVSADVAPTIGFLAGQYMAANRQADTHFRSLGRLLGDLDPGELGQLKQMMRRASHDRTSSQGFFDIEINLGYENNRSPGLYVDNDKFELPYVHRDYWRSAERLMYLLKREGFASTAKIKAGGSVDGAVTMQYKVARKLLATIDPESTVENKLFIASDDRFY